MKSQSRRSFLKKSAAAGIAAPLFVRNLMSQPPNGRVRHASFGAAGMAGGDLQSIASHPNVQVVCAAEVDTSRIGLLQKLAGGKVTHYQDWRVMLDKEGKNLNSVNVSVPDHMHAAMAMAAMQRGLHVYVQKPLCHDIYEVRRLTEVARERKLISQMGIQIHSAEVYRLGVKLIQDGAIGKVREVHLFSTARYGGGPPRPDRKDPIPASLNWDWWLGVAPACNYLAGYYHPFEWRRRLDFGTGSLGDMGCHIFDPVYEALALTNPTSVRSEGAAPAGHNWAVDSTVRYVFPGTRYTDGSTVRLTWYDGNQRPGADVQALLGTHKIPNQGSIFIGTKGTMLMPHVARPVLFPVNDFRDFQYPKVEGTNHYHQWVNAILGKGRTTTPFDYSGPLTETVLLGGLATRFPKTTLEWDAAKLTIRNSEDATRFVRRTYRKGWEVNGLSS
jgi:predicted dehydrogenase